MTLNERQARDYARLKAYYPYRLFFLVDDPRDAGTGPTIWAMRDRRAVNRVMREGGTVFEIA